MKPNALRELLRDGETAYGTMITDAGLAHLKGLTGLRVLDLQGTRITDAGVRALEEALPRLEVIR